MSDEHIHRNEKGHVLAEKSKPVEYASPSLSVLEYLMVGGGGRLVVGPVPDISAAPLEDPK